MTDSTPSWLVRLTYRDQHTIHTNGQGPRRP